MNSITSFSLIVCEGEDFAFLVNLEGDLAGEAASLLPLRVLRTGESTCISEGDFVGEAGSSASENNALAESLAAFSPVPVSFALT